MTQRFKDYSVGQLAQHSGVSVRTLHHYDDIGLLRPAYVGSNGYRYYRKTEILRLQEILFYREIGLSLSEIQQIIDSPFDTLSRLIRHRERLREQHRKTGALIETLEATIEHLKGQKDMEVAALYAPFTAQKQTDYEAWLITEYGADIIDKIHDSHAAIDKIPQGHDAALQQLQIIETELVTAFEAGIQAESYQMHDILEQHRHWIEMMWGRDCNADAFAGLADLYACHPDFIARYETLSARFSKWLPSAMKSHAARL